MEGSQIAKACSKSALELVDFSTSCINGELSMKGKKMVIFILFLAIVGSEFGDEEARRRARKPQGSWNFSLLHNKEARRRRRMKMLSLYRKHGWVPQLNHLIGLKTPSSGPQMDSTKKEELFNEISSFQKVYISWVSEILKLVSRFCAKRLFHPYHQQSGGLEVSNGNGANTKVVGNNKINQTGQKTDFFEYQINPKITQNTIKEPPKGPTKSKEFPK